MKTTQTKPRFFQTAIIFSVLALASLACSIGSLSLDRNSAVVEIKLTEERLNDVFLHARTLDSSNPHNLLDKITSIELHDGYLRAFGEGKTDDGTRISGSFDTSFAAVDGVLKVEIIGVDIPGIDLSDERIQDINHELSQELSEIAAESNGDVTFQEAKVEEDLLTLTVQVEFDQQ